MCVNKGVNLCIHESWSLKFQEEVGVRNSNLHFELSRIHSACMGLAMQLPLQMHGNPVHLCDDCGKCGAFDIPAGAEDERRAQRDVGNADADGGVQRHFRVPEPPEHTL